MSVRARLAAIAGIAAAVAVAACTDVGTDPQSVVSFVADTMPIPSVVAGDTLRDTLGLPFPLERLARAFNPRGDELPNAPATIVIAPSDTGLAAAAVAATASLATDVGRTYLVVGNPPLTSSTAVVVNLQYAPGLRVARRIEIVARPTAVTPTTATSTSIAFGATQTSRTATFSVIVTFDSAGLVRPVRATAVRFETDSALRTTRIDSVRFDVAGRLTTSRAVRYDTTDASGVASRGVVVFRSATATRSAVPDTLTVRVTTLVGNPLLPVTFAFRVPVSDSVSTTAGLR